MSVQVQESLSKKISVSVPLSLLSRLDHLIPSRQRSHFIVEAIKEQLAIFEQLVAIEESAGAWSDENHPDMQTDDDIDQWLHELRKGWSQGHAVP